MKTIEPNNAELAYNYARPIIRISGRKRRYLLMKIKIQHDNIHLQYYYPKLYIKEINHLNYINTSCYFFNTIGYNFNLVS